MLKTALVTFLLGLAIGPELTLTANAATRWRLETGDTEIRFALVKGSPFVTSLRCKGDKHDWLEAPSPISLMEQVWVGDKAFPTAWHLEKVEASRPAGQLTFYFTNAEPMLALRSIWRARAGHGPIEHWAEIENRSGQEVTLSCQDSLAFVGLRPGGPAQAHWIRRGGSNANTEGGAFQNSITNGFDLALDSNCMDGSSPVPWLAVQVGGERGLYVGWEFSGLGGIRANEKSAGLDLRVGNHAEFKTDIGPGAVFEVPPAFVGCYKGDVDEGSYCLHRFVLEKLRPRAPQNGPDPILAYNLYLDAGGDHAREADVLRSAVTCHDLGFEAFMPDAMWFPGTGDWRWDPARFPRGIKPIEEYVHGNGMKMALWCAWSNGGLSEDKGALNVRQHPDWFTEDFPPDWRPGAYWGGRLCLGCEPAKEWAIEKTHSLVSQNKLDYLKHDNDPIAMQCNKTDHLHHYGVDASYWATMGYYEVQEKLLKSFPNLLLENCSGGGHIKDFGIARRTHYTVTTDTLSNLADRRSIYDSTFALPPLVLQAYTYDDYYHVRGDNPGTFLWRSGMMSAWQIDPTDTAKWTPAESDSVRRSVRVYKQWIRPLLQDAKVYHILPRPDGKHWDGMFYWNPSLKKGIVYIFRPDSAEERQTVALKGLKSRGKYRVWCEDGSISPGVRTGEELTRTGLEIRLPGPYTSDLILLQDASLDKTIE